MLAPYCSMLTYSTRLTEMRRLVNDVIAPIAAQLAQQKHSQLAKLGCTVEEAPPGSMPADGKGISVAVGTQGRSLGSMSSSDGLSGQALPEQDVSEGTNGAAITQPVHVVSMGGSGSVKQRKGVHSKGAGAAASSGKSSGKGVSGAQLPQCTASVKHADGQAGPALSHKRFESGGSRRQQQLHTGLPCVLPRIWLRGVCRAACC